jgi:preprotein translocase subunit SecD
LGAENIRLGMKSVQVGLALVVVFMILYYRVFGIAAVIALSGNLVLLVGIMSLLGATLTLPGIAGIVLTVGMAVDANVLIFARIREEIRSGSPPQTAITQGFDRAIVTILDANITTLIVAIILYAIGTGPIKGFAVTLSVGIITSMFSSIMGTRALVNLIYGGRRVKSLAIGGIGNKRSSTEGAPGMKAIPFMKWRWVAVALSAAALLAAIGSLSVKQLNWGLDFTGGTLVEVAYSDSADLGAIRTELDREGYEGAVVVSFGTDRDVLVRLPDGYSDEQGALMVDKLRAATEMSIELRRIEFVGPQVGEELRDDGGIAMLTALGLVMLYVAFRFQIKFALGAGDRIGPRRDLYPRLLLAHGFGI